MELKSEKLSPREPRNEKAAAKGLHVELVLGGREGTSEVHTDMAMRATVATKRAAKGREMMWQRWLSVQPSTPTCHCLDGGGWMRG